MRKEDFIAPQMGALIPIQGQQGLLGEFTHVAFLPSALPESFEDLSSSTYRACSAAAAKMAAFNQSLTHLPRASIFRNQVINQEAHATSAIEGTHTQLVKVIEADEKEILDDRDLREVYNYSQMATFGFAQLHQSRLLSLQFLRELHQILFYGLDGIKNHGQWRNELVYLGARSGLLQSARFIPVPPGDQLLSKLEEFVSWENRHTRSGLDPIIVVAATHYMFETLHPFEDGNGRIGRFILLSQLMETGTLIEPVAISTWIEQRRSEYTGLLYRVSTNGAWDEYISFIAQALEASATQATFRIQSLLKISAELKEVVTNSGARSNSASLLIDFGIQKPIFTVNQASAGIQIGYAGTNKLISKCLDLNILKPYGESKYGRKFYFPGLLTELLKS